MYRIENDSLGKKQVPVDALYGIQTLRAVDNFVISGRSISHFPKLIRALAQVKKSAAMANKSCKLLGTNKAKAIIRACDEIIDGQWHDAFPIDPIQGGAGTSTNMNMNEVIANRALDILGHNKGDYDYLHPNDDVNQSQSTNDAYATAVRLSLYDLNTDLITGLSGLRDSFANKSAQFTDVGKLGRTQLQDAVPMTVAQELHAYAVTIAEDIERAKEIGALFLEVNLGGTAIGSAVGADTTYFKEVLPNLRAVTGLALKRSKSLFEASWDTGAFVLYSGLIKRVAVKLSKIANDLRLLCSGPHGGLGEYGLPPRQPGSSIMPGKVNPVIPEVMNQVCFKAFGADTTVTFACEAGQLQLNAFEPLILQSLYEVIEMLINAIQTFRIHCIEGLSVNRQRCRESLDNSTALATRLIPYTGYDEAARLAKSAIDKGLSFKDYIINYHPHLTVHMQ